ncbi:hypothetical protein RQP46_001109 [Phenoliferia psychrophenolica]
MARPKMSRNKRLTIAWTIFSFLFLSSAIVMIIVTEIWQSQDANSLRVPDKHTLRAMSLSQLNLNAAIVAAVVIIVSFCIGCAGFYTGLGPGKEQMGLLVFNYSLVFTMLVTVTVGSIMWLYTLTERNDFAEVWLLQNGAVQSFVQDSMKCCGYWNATTSGLLTQATGFCASITNVTAVTPCVGPVTSFAE